MALITLVGEADELTAVRKREGEWPIDVHVGNMLVPRSAELVVGDLRRYDVESTDVDECFIDECLHRRHQTRPAGLAGAGFLSRDGAAWLGLGRPTETATGASISVQ